MSSRPLPENEACTLKPQRSQPQLHGKRCIGTSCAAHDGGAEPDDRRSWNTDASHIKAVQKMTQTQAGQEDKRKRAFHSKGCTNRALPASFPLMTPQLAPHTRPGAPLPLRAQLLLSRVPARNGSILAGKEGSAGLQSVFDRWRLKGKCLYAW